MLERALLYFIPSQGRDNIAKGGEFLKIQPGTGDNLTRDDIADGYTGYVIWNRLAPECLDIDGDLPMECIDSGMILLKEDSFDVLGTVMRYAYGENAPGAIPLLW